jgi:predicted nucleotidyltransferase
VWPVKKVSPNKMVHLTEKPVELARRGDRVQLARPCPGCATIDAGGPMSTLIDRYRPQIEALCRTYRVRRLDVFGSVIREDFDPVHSDVDFLVEFEPDPDLNMFHAYMGLRGDLSRLLDRHVDLVMPSAVRNPYFAQEIAASSEHLYGA